MGEVINIQQLLEVGMGRAQPRLPELKAKAVHDIVRDNAEFLLRTQWKKGQPQYTTVQNVARKVASPKLETLELIARRAQIPVWYLLLPLSEKILADREHKLEQLVKAYINAGDEGRQAICSIAKLTAK